MSVATDSRGLRARPVPEMVPIEHETSDRVVRTMLITALERCHLASDVVRIAPERQQARALRDASLITSRLETSR